MVLIHRLVNKSCCGLRLFILVSAPIETHELIRSVCILNISHHYGQDSSLFRFFRSGYTVHFVISYTRYSVLEFTVVLLSL